MEPTSNNTSRATGGPRRRTQAGQRYSAFVFTINNWTQEEYDWITKEFIASCKWLRVAREHITEGTPHLQGAAILKNQTSRSTISKLPGFRRAWHHTMNGKPEHSVVYTSKEDPTPFEFGSFAKSGQGKRTDLLNTTEEILKGRSLAELVREDPAHAVTVVKYHKGLSFVQNLIQVQRTTAPKVYWLSGPTGVGKTRAAHEFSQYMGIPSDRDNIWISRGTFQWFDGYSGQKLAIMDDFRAKQLPNFAYLLRLLDRYDMQVPFKGGFAEWRPEVIIFTCPTNPDICFEKRKEHVPEDINQLHRRITLIVEMNQILSDSERHSKLTEMAKAGGYPVVLPQEAEENQAASTLASLSHITLAQPSYPCSEEEDRMFSDLDLSEEDLIRRREKTVFSHDSDSDAFFVPATQHLDLALTSEEESD